MRRCSAKSDLELREIRLHGRLHVGILQLAGERRAVLRVGAMHLAERGRGRGLAGRRSRSAPRQSGAELGQHAPRHEGRAHRRRLGLQLLQLGGIFGRQQVRMVASSCATFMIGPLRPPSAAASAAAFGGDRRRRRRTGAGPRSAPRRRRHWRRPARSGPRGRRSGSLPCHRAMAGRGLDRRAVAALSQSGGQRRRGRPAGPQPSRLRGQARSERQFGQGASTRVRQPYGLRKLEFPPPCEPSAAQQCAGRSAVRPRLGMPRAPWSATSTGRRRLDLAPQAVRRVRAGRGFRRRSGVWVRLNPDVGGSASPAPGSPRRSAAPAAFAATRCLVPVDGERRVRLERR